MSSEQGVGVRFPPGAPNRPAQVKQVCYNPAMLDDEFNYNKTNLQDLLKTHKGKYIVIKDQKVVGEYGDEKSAYIDASNKWELGTFLIKKCIPEKEEIVQTFHSRVVFA